MIVLITWKNRRFIYFLLFFLIVSASAYSQDTLRHIGINLPMTSYKEHNMAQQFCGYTTGQSCSNYEVFAERYDISDSAEVIEIISYHGGKVRNTGRLVEFEIYSVGQNKMPGTLLGSKSQSYRNLFVTGNPVITNFPEPVKVGKSFFVALNFLDYAHFPLTDTIAILSSEDGSRPDSDLGNIGRNVLRIHHYDFVDLYSETGLKINLALFPVIQFPVVTGTNQKYVANSNLKLFAPFPNPCVNQINLTYTLLKNSGLSISVIDESGKQMLLKDLGSKVMGTHTEILDVTALSNGHYTILVTSTESVMGLKFIK